MTFTARTTGGCYHLTMNKEGKRIVIVNQTSGYLMRDIARAFMEEYEQVTVLASLALDGVRTDRIIAYDKRSSVRRVLTWCVATVQIWWKVFWKYRDDELFIVSNPPMAPLLPLILRNPFSVLIYDIYPDVLVNQQVIKTTNLLARWWRKANRRVFARAERVYTIGEGMRDCLSQYADAEKIKVVPLWPNDTHIQPIAKDDNLFIKEHHLEGQFVVLYSGNLGSTHRVEVLVDVARSMEDVTFVIIGEGAKKKLIAERVEREECRNVMLLPYQPLETLSHVLSAADVAVVTLDMGASQMSVPSKTFNLMAVGAPIMGIASPESELGRLVGKYGMGRLFMPEDIDGMVAFIREMKEDDALRTTYSRHSLGASRFFTSENAKMFLKVFFVVFIALLPLTF